MIVIIDYQAGNIRSIQNMLRKIGCKSTITSNPEEIEKADKLILPGVGSFDHGVENLHASGLFDAIIKKATNGTPLLGICLGAQLLGHNSQEGNLQGLGLIDMQVVKFNREKLADNIKIPHMGWSEIAVKKESPILANMQPNPRFYFVHSYHFVTNNNSDQLTTSFYGYEFCSSFQINNIIGVQFHPEKSHKFGMELLRNFRKI
jgi:glutamine amidotransferase